MHTAARWMMPFSNPLVSHIINNETISKGRGDKKTVVGFIERKELQLFGSLCIIKQGRLSSNMNVTDVCKDLLSRRENQVMITIRKWQDLWNLITISSPSLLV